MSPQRGQLTSTVGSQGWGGAGGGGSPRKSWDKVELGMEMEEYYGLAQGGMISQWDPGLVHETMGDESGKEGEVNARMQAQGPNVNNMDKLVWAHWAVETHKKVRASGNITSNKKKFQSTHTGTFRL